jgi:UDP-3-O-[3-hydroxymyristoyl] glucosamine N-acyltransferase
VSIGVDSMFAAGAEISGSVVIGDGVWYGPSACCNHEVTIGDYAFIGTGSVITRDVEPFSLVAGSPARHLRYVCRCRSAMDFERDSRCSACGSEYKIGPDGEIQVVQWGSRFGDAS